MLSSSSQTIKPVGTEGDDCFMCFVYFKLSPCIFETEIAVMIVAMVKPLVLNMLFY